MKCDSCVKIALYSKQTLKNYYFCKNNDTFINNDTFVGKQSKMSIWYKIQTLIGVPDRIDSESTEVCSKERNASLYAFVDTEVDMRDKKVHDIGALRHDGAVYHGGSRKELLKFLDGIDFLCGHNIIWHDAKYLFGEECQKYLLVDTLHVSPLLFPERPYHKLLKDEKLLTDELNNPVNDCQKARSLLMDEVAAWNNLSREKQRIYAALLHKTIEFEGFISFVSETQPKELSRESLADLIRICHKGKICENAPLETFVEKHPIELAYALALVDTSDHRSITPRWVIRNYPNVENLVRLIRHTRCNDGCAYCNSLLNVHKNLKTHFGYDEFRTYEGEPLQENATKAAVEGKSVLAIFPTGGGKSLTFQLPALMEGQTVHGLTVVISPLQSLMKDQVDNLVDRGITDAVTINGLLDPISRSLAIQRVTDGDVSLLYISPEMLRSNTIEAHIARSPCGALCHR